MSERILTVVSCLFALAWTASGASLHGSVVDQSGGIVADAHIGVFSRVGLTLELTTGQLGEFLVESLPGDAARLVITASGFSTQTIPLPAVSPVRIVLALAPLEDSIRVAGSTIDLPASQQASSITVINDQEIRERNEQQASELLRTVPGVEISQAGHRGGVTAAYLRGGDSNYALVTMDGTPVNSFQYGGGFDFSQVPTDFLNRIEVVRGAQSAVYGSYANSGVVNFVTRSSENSGPAVDLIADGGSHGERRFAASGSGNVAGFGLALALSRTDIDSSGDVPNSDWRNENVLLHINRNWGRQSVSASGHFNSNAEGDPGPYGSDPVGLYSGIDLITRDKNNNSDYTVHYEADLTSRVRGELFGGFFLGNSLYVFPGGNSFNKDLRGQSEGRAVISVARDWTMSAGFVWGREEMKNTYITDNSAREFPLRRDEEGIYWENRFQFRHFYLQAGVRGEIFETPLIPAYDSPFSLRPQLPANTYGRVNPKLAAAYQFLSGTRLHASVGTGIRPPGGFDLAFTTNPNLKPERSTSFDAGVSQSFAAGKLTFDGTFFYTRYADLIVSLGGSLSNLSAFTTDNLANAKAQGAEFTAQFRPARWVAFTGNYTYLDTEVLALDHSSGLAQAYYQVGQQLARRAPHSGSFRLALGRGRLIGDAVGYIRGDTLDVEPNYGTSAGFFSNPGYADLALNLNMQLKRGLSVFGTVRNLLDQRYEEVFGYPSPRLTFLSGVKWSLRGRDF